MTGGGIVLPNEDAEEVARRYEALEAEMRPRSELARQLMYRVALMTIRLGRSAEHEAKMLARGMREAAAEFDLARLAEVDRLIAWIAAEPVTNSRRLRRMPEGIDRVIEALQGLRSDLARVGGHRWTAQHNEQLHNLLGKRTIDLPVSREQALTDAIAGKFGHLDATDGQGLEGDARRVWAIGALVHLIEDHIAGLKTLREGLDLEGLELDRAEAAARAMFDPSKDAVLARKYEAANERGLFRALREFRELQGSSEVVEEPQDPEELGSFFPEAPAEPESSVAVDSTNDEPVEPEPSKSTDEPQITPANGREFTSATIPTPDRAPDRVVRGG